MTREQTHRVPDDFPRGDDLASVSGLQTKLVGRLVDGKFVEGWTDEERLAHFDVCSDLVEQLCAYCLRKLAELPGMDLPTLLPRVRRGVHEKGWGLSGPELDWIMKHVSEKLESPTGKQ